MFRKLTENKFRVGVERGELVEDWDQREVSSTLTRQQAGYRLELVQRAEPGRRYCEDSRTLYQALPPHWPVATHL